MRLREVWLSPPCNTYCKLGVINKEHPFRDKKDPLRKPIKGTKKGEQAEEVDALVQKALQLIEFLARKKAGQLRTGKMMVVDGVEVDLRGMEWFMEGMQDYMQQFLEEFQYDVVQKTVDYCAWGHYYQKPTHVWTSMIFWEPSGTQAGGIGKCRQQCPYGEIGHTRRWVHEFSVGQESHRVMGGEGRQSSKGAVPRDLHKEICRVRQAHYKVK